jgi:hypothetical protein
MSQSITLGSWQLNPASGEYESGYDGLPAGQIAVVGTGFGTKPYSTPITWETFNGTDGQLVSAYNADWVGYNGNDGGLISTLNPRFAGHKSAYNVATRNQFDTNYKTNTARKSRTRYLSYYTRVNYREDLEEGQIKFARISTSVASGGGGVYNGVGVQTLNAPAPKSTQAGWSGSNGAFNSPGYLNSAWYPDNRWIRVEYEVYLSDLDVSNGFYNIHCAHQGSLLSGNIMQRFSGHSADNYLLDTTLLGIETVNTETWVTPNVLTPSTTYTVTVVKSSVPYIGTYTSGGSVPTAAEIIDGIKATILIAGLPSADVHTNPANTGEIGFYWNTTVTYTSNISRTNPISVQQSETYEDDDFKRFYIGNADTWAACTESNPQPYTAWSDTYVQLIKYVGAISGRTWLYKQLTPNSTPVRVGEVVGDTIIYG